VSHSAQGLAWLARRSSGMAMPVTAQAPKAPVGDLLSLLRHLEIE